MLLIFGVLLCATLSQAQPPNIDPTAQAQVNQSPADQTPANAEQLLEKEQIAFRAAVQSVADCVVQIETFGGLERVGQELIAEGPTTGTILSSDGWIISSLFSFRAQPASILVSMPDGKRAAARIVARDFSRELVLLKIDEVSDLPVPSVCPTSEVTVGQWAIALGKTFDNKSVSQSVGIISALGRAYDKAIQCDAKISPVNYGGPLVDLQGRVVGILAPVSPGAFLEGDSSELYDSGIGFAIPMQDILDRLKRMQAGENIRGGKLGVVASDQNEFVGPVKVAGTAPGSPASKAGVKAGDVLIEAAGKPVRMLAHLSHALGPTDAGQTLKFAVDRDGQRIDLECELAEEIPTYRQRYVGVRVRKLESGEIEISRVEVDSPAAKAGLAVGDRIVECNGEKVTDPADFKRLIAVAEIDNPMRLVVEKESKRREIQLTAALWPKDIPTELPPAGAGIDESMVCELVDLTLGDFPNKAFALVPPLAAKRELGLLVLYPEPGEVDRTKVQSTFTTFARDQGWIVAIIPSSNPNNWAREEAELASRALGRLENAYKLDPSRIVFGGIGVGGRLGIMAAGSERKRVAGALIIGTELETLALRAQNAPLESLQFLFAGKPEALEAAVAKLDENGFWAQIVPMVEFAAGKWDLMPIEPITRWLEGLGRL
jgi:serine protease Do